MFSIVFSENPVCGAFGKKCRKYYIFQIWR